MKKQRNRKPARRMSGSAKWTVTLILCLVAVLTVATCARQGIFSFKPGAVQANDQAVTETPTPTDSGDEAEKLLQHKVFISSGKGGTAEPTGCVNVEDWGSLTVKAIPDEGYRVKDITVDSESKGAQDSITLSYVREDQVVLVSFEKIPEPTPEGTDDKLFGDD